MKKLLAWLVGLGLSLQALAQQTAPVYQLIERVTPGYAAQFDLQIIPPTDEGEDVFEVAPGRDGKRYYIGHKESGEPTADRVYKRTLRWLTVEIAGLDLKLTAEPNTTGEDRTFEIVVEAYYKNGTITGVQKGQ